MPHCVSICLKHLVLLTETEIEMDDLKTNWSFITQNSVSKVMCQNDLSSSKLSIIYECKQQLLRK